jgi:hypothetical protein
MLGDVHTVETKSMSTGTYNPPIWQEKMYVHDLEEKPSERNPLSHTPVRNDGDNSAGWGQEWREVQLSVWYDERGRKREGCEHDGKDNRSGGVTDDPVVHAEGDVEDDLHDEEGKKVQQVSKGKGEDWIGLDWEDVR